MPLLWHSLYHLMLQQVPHLFIVSQTPSNTISSTSLYQESYTLKYYKLSDTYLYYHGIRICTATASVSILPRHPYLYCHGIRICTATASVSVLPRHPYLYCHGIRIYTATVSVSILPRYPYLYCHGIRICTATVSVSVLPRVAK